VNAQAHTTHAASSTPVWYRKPTVIAGLGLAALALTLLGIEHRDWLVRYWPYLLFAACPLMHLFGHHHGHGGSAKSDH
jgi:hypothetical protein